MAHIGQELALGSIRAFGRPQAILEFGPVLFELNCPAAHSRISQTQCRKDRAESQQDGKLT